MAAFWQEFTGQTHGASFDKEPKTREEILSEAREREAEMAAAAPNPNSSDAGKADNRADRFHENDEQKRTRVLSDVYVNACLQGEHVTSAAYWQSRPDRIEKHTAGNCQHLLPSGLPCHHNLWAGGKPELESHLQQFMGLARKQRSQAVYDELSPFSWHCPPLPDGSKDPNGVPSWHFFMNDRMVCKCVYVMNNPIGDSTLREKLARYKNERPTAHNSSEVGWEPTSSNMQKNRDWKAISCIAWYQYQALQTGDLMPDEDQTILPLREKKDEWKEFCAARTCEIPDRPDTPSNIAPHLLPHHPRC